MRLSKKGAGSILGHEAVYLYAYPDPGTGGDPITIGAGHTAAAGGMKPQLGQTITLNEAFEIFRADMARFENGVTNAVQIPLGQHQFEALVSFHFNTGAIKTGSVDDKLNRGDAGAAMDTLQRYINAGGKPMNGLIKRRREERAMFEHGVYPTRGIVLREHPSRKARTLNPENIPWDAPDPPPAINIKPDDFVIPPVPAKKPGFSLFEFLKLIWRWINEPVVKPA